MEKPVVFVSHSSKDEAVVRKLSDALRDKTGGAIEIFVSSDGESIPFGRNWVHTIQEALDRASLMFVLLSPNSVGSQWIYFEAGYSYSRQRRVIPIGILGIDLSVLTPPISLLQGFNLTSAATLNNLLVVINKAFGHTHKLIFTDADYDLIFKGSQPPVDSWLQEYTEWIDSIRISLRLPFGVIKPYVEQVLKSAKLPFRSTDFELSNFGATYRRRIYHPHGTPEEELPLIVDIDPSLAARNIQLFEKTVTAYATEVGADALPEAGLQIFFSPWIDYIRETHRLTAKLPGSGIQFGQYAGFVFRGRSFYLSRGTDYDNPDAVHVERVALSVDLPAGQLSNYDLLGLLRTLFHHNILFAGSNPY